MKPSLVALRLAGAFCLLASVLVVVGWQGIGHMRQLNATMQETIVDQWTEVRLTQEAYHLSEVNSRITLLVFLLDDPEEIEKLLAERLANTKRISEVMLNLEPRLNPDEALLFASVKATRIPYVKSYQQALFLKFNAHQSDAARDMMVNVVRPNLIAYHNAWDVFDQHEAGEIDQVIQQSKTDYIADQRNFLLTVVLAGVITGAIAFFTVKRMHREMAVRHRAEELLRQTHDQLEQRIVDRTAELVRTNERLRLLNSAVLQSREAILITEANLDLPGPTIIFINPAFTEMTGYTPEETIGKTPRILQGPLTDKAVLSQLRQNLDRGEMFAGEAINYRKDGTPFDLEWQIAPLRDADDKITHFVAIQRDITGRKQVQLALKVSELRYRSLFENMLEGYMYCRILYDEGRAQDYRYLEVNTAFGQLTGLENVVGKKVSEVVPGIRETNAEILEIYARVALTGKPEKFEKYRESLGKWFAVSVYSQEQEHFVAVFDNITERKLAEETLRRRQSELQALFDLMPAMIWFKDTENRILRVNERVAQTTGKSVREMEGKSMDEIYPQEAAGYYADDLEVIASRAPKLGIVELLDDQEGKKLWIQTDKVPVCDNDGEVVGIIVMAQDITEKKRTDARFSRLMDSDVQGIVFWKTTGEITGANEAFLRLVHYTRQDLETGRLNWMAMTPPEGTDRDRQALEEIASRGACTPFEKEFIRKDGLRVPVLVGAAVFEDSPQDGICFVLDLTERKKIEAQLFQSQKMETVGKLTGGIAHEFNSILTAIIGQSEFLLDDLPAGGPLAQRAMEINKAADRAASLTRQLLAYGRNQTLQPRILDLNAVLAGMGDSLRLLMGRKTEVELVPAAGLKSVKVDAGQMEQVILNMAINASDAMPNGGKLTLETANVVLDQDYVRLFPDAKMGDYVMLAITDTGTGMDPETRARIFEPFFTTKGIGQGSGLGLSTSHGIIQQSGGHISVQSAPGQGATFKIYLPQVDPMTKPPPAALDSSNLPCGTESILLVEDDPALREMAETLLRRLGYTVLTAATGGEALNRARQHGSGFVDLLFADFAVSDMTVRKLSERIRALYPQIKILLTCAAKEKTDPLLGPEAGGAFLQKPFSPFALARKLREVLDRPCAERPATG